MWMSDCRIALALVPLFVACVTAGPIEDPEATSSSGADSTPMDDGHSSTAGTSVSTTANVSASDSDTATSGGDPITGPGDDTEGPDPSGTTGSETSTSGNVTGFDTEGKDTLLEMCGIEPPDGPVGTGQIQCGCEHCALDWFGVDQALYDAISPQCGCLCEAAGCGGWQGSEATSVDGEEATGDDVNDTGDPSTTGGNAE